MSEITQQGRARCPGLTYQQLLDTDSHPVPDVLRIESPAFFGVDDIPVARYTSRAFHELEVERLWRRVWQVACREEDLPEVGDTEVYDIAGLSFLLVRVTPDVIKAYWNACLHRGRQLRERGGRVEEIRCPFHGYCWHLDGSLKHVPCAWDFPQVGAASWSLPEVRVGRWGGFVFVNPDPGAESLESFLATLPDHFRRWPLENRYAQVHVAKVLRCNWKAAQEAFMESLHVVATHPRLLPGIGDANSQYDVFGNFNRLLTANLTPSPHLKWGPSEQEMYDSALDRRLDEPPVAVVPDGLTAREFAARGAREALRPVLGPGVEELCDAELNDSILYSVFPNFHPWGAYNRIAYRFRPNGDSHQEAIWDTWFLSPFAGERPPAARVHCLGVDEDFRAAPELGFLAQVFNQDVFNLPKVAVGLRSLQKPGVSFSAYQESKIRHFHQLLGRWLDAEDRNPLTAKG